MIKKYIVILLILILSFSSCSIFKTMFIGPEQIGIISSINNGTKTNSMYGFYNFYFNDNEEVNVYNKGLLLKEDFTVDIKTGLSTLF